MRWDPAHDAKGQFARQYHGCKVEGCEREHNSKGFCKRHLKASEHGRIDASGKPVPLRCQLCGVLYVPPSAPSRFCPACRPLHIRARERAWKKANASVVRMKVRGWKRRHRQAVLRRNRTRVRLKRARLRLTDPGTYRELLKKQACRQKFLQASSLAYLRRRGRWSEREVELLREIYHNAARAGEWESLFRVLGRTYVSIRGKWRAIRADRRGQRT